MFGSIFDPDSPFWRRFSRFMDLFGLSLCWLFCSIPVVTLGAATTALYDGVYHGIRCGENGPYARFFSTLRRELKTSFLVLLPGLALFGLYHLLFRMAYIMAVTGNQAAGVLVYAYRVLFCVPLAVWLFSCATLSRFTFGPVALVKTAGQLAFAHLPSAAAVTVLTLFAVRVMLWWPFSVIFLPAITAWAVSFPLERIFGPYLNPEP